MRLVPPSLLIAAAALIPLHAQIPSLQPASRPFGLLVPFVPPIPGEPITATYRIALERRLPGAATESLCSTARVARDSSGRLFHELRAMLPATSSAEPDLLSLVLFDPRTGVRRTLDPATRTSVERQVRLATDIRLFSAGASTQDLGVKIINGFAAHGLRATRSIPAEPSAAGRPRQDLDETWYSTELGLIVFQRRTSPAGQVLTVSLSAVDRAEPSAALFRAPAGFQVVRQIVVHGPGSTVRIVNKSLTARQAAAHHWPVLPPSYDPNTGTGDIFYPSSLTEHPIDGP